MKYLFLSVLLSFSALLFAQNNFSLNDCIEYTLNNHPSVKVYENNIKIAQAQSKQALGLYLPSITGSATAIDNIQLQTTILPAGILSPEAAEIQFGTTYNTTWGVDVSQTIFDQSKIVGIKANKPYKELTNLQNEQNKENLMYNTASAFIYVLIYEEQLNLLEANQYKYTEMLKVLKHQYSKGIVLENDVNRINISLHSTNYQIEDVTIKENNAINSLKNTMGMNMSETLTISDSLDFEKLANLKSDTPFDLNNLKENKMNELNVSLQKFNFKSQQAGMLPTITAVGKWGNQALNNDFSDAFSNWNDFSYIGLSLNIPLFNGLIRRQKSKEEKIKLDNEKLNFFLNQQNLQLRYDNAKSEITSAFSSYTSNKDNMELAKNVLSVTDYQYKHGTASLTDYLNDDTAYKQAQTNYLNSLYNLMISQLSYQKSKGTLSEYLMKFQDKNIKYKNKSK